MKKLYVDLALSLLYIITVIVLCLLLSSYAQRTVNALIECADLLPETDAFEVLKDTAELDALISRAQALESETKRAGKILALFINHDLVNRAELASSMLAASVLSQEKADYAAARSALLDALYNLLRVEKPTPELFF